MSAYHTFEIYPPRKDGEEGALYFIEITRWDEKAPLRWQLFQRNYMYSNEEWAAMLAKADEKSMWLLMGRECHPWNMGEGIVNELEGVIDMNTRRFLHYMVDALNLKAERDKHFDTLFKKPEKSS